MTLEAAPIKVAIFQPVIPSYRIPFFTALHRRSAFQIEIFASMSAPGSPDTPKVPFEFSFHPIQYYPFLNNKLSWQSGCKIPKHFHKGDVIVICGNPRYLHNYLILLAARKRGLGFVSWSHGHTPGPKRWTEEVRKRIMKLADVILLYTDKEVEDYRRSGFSTHKLFATNNTIDIRDIEIRKKRWSQVHLASFRCDFGLNRTKNILYCGRLKQNSELPVAFAALAILRQRDSAYRLIIIGDGSEKKSLMARAKELKIMDAILWCGAVPEEEEAPWFLSAFVFVYPGSIGLSLMHAFSYSLPVITHNVAEWHSPEFAALRDDYNGLLFKRGDALDLSRKIEALSNDPTRCTQMGINALETMKNDFSFENMVDRFLQAVSAASGIAKGRI